MFGTDDKYKTIIGYNVLIFAIMLFYGVTIGTYDREGYLGADIPGVLVAIEAIALA